MGGHVIFSHYQYFDELLDAAVRLAAHIVLSRRCAAPSTPRVAYGSACLRLQAVSPHALQCGCPLEQKVSALHCHAP